MEPIFVNCFWGERHQGFDVLQHNLKSASKATLDMIDFLRDSCSLQDYYQKTLNKLASKAGAFNNSGSFTPCWSSVKQLLEKQSASHLELHQYLISLMKDVQRYSEEQTRKHKELKDGEGATQEVVNSFQTSSQQLQKAKDFYHSRYMDLQKIRRTDNPSSRELEKTEGRLKKAQNDYKYMIERYNNSRNAFLEKMRASCSHFQEVEQNHLDQMREFLSRYGNGISSQMQEEATALQEYERSILVDKSIINLLHQFASEKGTGTQEPAMASFEDGEVAAAFERASTVSINTIGSNSQRSSSRTTNDERSIASSAATVGLPNDRVGGGSARKDNHNTSDMGEHRNSDRSSHSVASSLSGAVPPNVGTVQIDVGSASRRWDTGNFFTRKKHRKKDNASNPTTTTAINSASESRASTSAGDWRSDTPVEPPVDDQGFSLPPADLWSRRDLDEKNVPSSDSSSENSDTDTLSKPFPKVVIRPLDDATNPVSNSRPASSILHDVPLGLDPDRSSVALDNSVLGQSIPLPPAPIGGGRAKKGRTTPQLRVSVATVKQNAAAAVSTNVDTNSNSNGRTSNSTSSNPTDAWGMSFSQPQSAAADNNNISFDLLGSDVAQPPEDLQIPPTKRHGSIDSTLDPFSTPLQSPADNKPRATYPTPSSFGEDISLAFPSIPSSIPPSIVNPPKFIQSQSVPMDVPPPLDDKRLRSQVFGVPILPPRPRTKMTDPWGGDATTLSTSSFTEQTSSLVNNTTTLKTIVEQRSLSVIVSGENNSQTLPRDKTRPLPPPPPTSVPPLIRSPNPSLNRIQNVTADDYSSRGASPIHPPASLDSIPVAVAVSEVYHACFHGPDGDIIHRRVNGELSIAFSAAIVRRIMDMATLSPLEFRIEDSKAQIKNLNWDAKYFQECRDDGHKRMNFFMNMDNLREWIKFKREQEPDCKYISVDLLKYEVSLQAEQSPPLLLKSIWQCETENILYLRVDYQFLLKEFPPVNFIIKVDLPFVNVPNGEEKTNYLQSIESRPEQFEIHKDRVEWTIATTEMTREGNGSLCVKFIKKEEKLEENERDEEKKETSNNDNNNVKLSPKPIQVSFTFSHRQLSETLFELGNSHYHLSLYKKRLLAGSYICEPLGEREFV